MKKFESINEGYNSVFKVGQLSIGIVVPIENYANSSVPKMDDHLTRVQLVEQLGFKAIWLRDVPLHVPAFGDAGQTYDPFTYAGYLAGQTTRLAIGMGSIALPLHHPVHVMKSAATIDQLSGGRIILGVASGDRPSEYPAMGFDFESRGAAFVEAFNYIRAIQENFPSFSSATYGTFNGQGDVLPKATAHKLPLLVTGHCRQNEKWIAEHSDGWIYYPRNYYMLESYMKEFRSAIPESQGIDKPFMQPLYVDFQEDDNFEPQHIHLGFRLGAKHLITHLSNLRKLGVNHVALNLRFNTGEIEKILKMIAQKILPHFHLETK